VNVRALSVLLAAMCLGGCAEDHGPAISITDVRILAPMPGSSAGVAYFRIENRGETAITLDHIDSPQYEDVQMHETTIEEGVSRMRPIERVLVNPSSSVDFVPGGKHVMMMRPSMNVTPGSLIELEFHYDGGLLIVNATMQNRMPDE
jgi:copper(I)-binding protein